MKKLASKEQTDTGWLERAGPEHYPLLSLFSDHSRTLQRAEGVHTCEQLVNSLACLLKLGAVPV